MRNQRHLFVFDNFRFDHDADFASGLDGVRTFHPVEGSGDLFEFFQTFDEAFQIFAAGTRTSGRNRIRSLNQAGNDGLRFPHRCDAPEWRGAPHGFL